MPDECDIVFCEVLCVTPLCVTPLCVTTLCVTTLCVTTLCVTGGIVVTVTGPLDDVDNGNGDDELDILPIPGRKIIY